MTVIICRFSTLIFVNASLSAPVEPCVAVLAIALSVDTDRWARTIHGTLFAQSTGVTISNVGDLANALFDRCTRIARSNNALGKVVTLCARIGLTTSGDSVSLETVLTLASEPGGVGRTVRNTISHHMTIIIFAGS